MMHDERKRRLVADEVLVVKCPRSFVAEIDRATGTQMISRSAWVRQTLAERLGSLNRAGVG
jgi:hypothetical protein